jgi:hypothetical protein
MKYKKDWTDLSDSQLEIEIDERFKMVDQMVGTLYPEILRNEIAELRLILYYRHIDDKNTKHRGF